MRTKPVEIFAAEDFPVSAETFLVQHKPATLGSKETLQHWDLNNGKLPLATLGSQKKNLQHWDLNNGNIGNIGISTMAQCMICDDDGVSSLSTLKYLRSYS